MKLVKESLLDNDIILEYDLRQLQQKRQKEIEDLLNDKRTKPNKTFDTPQYTQNNDNNFNNVSPDNKVETHNNDIIANTEDITNNKEEYPEEEYVDNITNNKEEYPDKTAENNKEDKNDDKSSFLSKGYDFVKSSFEDDEYTKTYDDETHNNIVRKSIGNQNKRKKQEITNEDVKKFITHEAYKRFLKKHPDAKPNIFKSFFTVSPYEYNNTKGLKAEKYENLINNRLNAFEKKYEIEKRKKESKKSKKESKKPKKENLDKTTQDNITNTIQNTEDNIPNYMQNTEKNEPVEAKKINNDYNNKDAADIKYVNNINNDEYKKAAEDKSYYDTNDSYFTNNSGNEDNEDRKFTYQYDTDTAELNKNTDKKSKPKEKLVYNKKIKSYLSELKYFVDEKDPFKIKDAINLYKKINKEQKINKTSKNKSIANNANKEVYTNIAKKFINALIKDGLQLVVNTLDSSDKLDKDEYENLMGLLNVYNNNYTYKILPDNKNTLTKAKKLRGELIKNTDVNNVLEQLSFYMLSDKLENIYENIVFDIKCLKEYHNFNINNELNNTSIYKVSKHLLNESINIQSDTNLNKIAKEMGVSLSMLTDELELGMEIEKKYTDNKSTAFKMAMKNIQNKPTYYSEIKRIQNLIKKHKK